MRQCVETIQRRCRVCDQLVSVDLVFFGLAYVHRHRHNRISYLLEHTRARTASEDLSPGPCGGAGLSDSVLLPLTVRVRISRVAATAGSVRVKLHAEIELTFVDPTKRWTPERREEAVSALCDAIGEIEFEIEGPPNSDALTVEASACEAVAQ